MDWRTKVESYRKRLNEFNEEMEKETGIPDAKILVTITGQVGIDSCIKDFNIWKNASFTAFPIQAAGASSRILSSRLYPEFGILIFDGYELCSGSDVIFEFGDYRRAIFQLVCACCGLDEASGVCRIRVPGHEDEKIINYFKAVYEAAECNGITILFFQCYNEHHHDPPMPKHKNLRLVGFHDLHEIVDQWRFASAFKDVIVGGYKFPFEGLFKKMQSIFSLIHKIVIAPQLTFGSGVCLSRSLLGETGPLVVSFGEKLSFTLY